GDVEPVAVEAPVAVLVGREGAGGGAQLGPRLRRAVRVEAGGAEAVAVVEEGERRGLHRERVEGVAPRGGLEERGEDVGELRLGEAVGPVDEVAHGVEGAGPGEGAEEVAVHPRGAGGRAGAEGGDALRGGGRGAGRVRRRG